MSEVKKTKLQILEELGLLGAIKEGEESECYGLIGKIFGHKFKSYLIKSKYKQEPWVNFNVEGKDNVEAFIESQRDIYKIRCKRCGKVSDE